MQNFQNIAKSLVSSLRAQNLVDGEIGDVIVEEAGKMETPAWLTKYWWVPVLIVTIMPLLVKGLRWLYDRYLSDDEPLTPLEAAKELVTSLERQQRVSQLGLSSL